MLQVSDLNMCLRSLDFSLILSKEIGDTGQDSDILGEIADVYAEFGDLEKAGKVCLLLCFQNCIQGVSLAVQPTVPCTSLDKDLCLQFYDMCIEGMSGDSPVPESMVSWDA